LIYNICKSIFDNVYKFIIFLSIYLWFSGFQKNWFYGIIPIPFNTESMIAAAMTDPA